MARRHPRAGAPHGHDQTVPTPFSMRSRLWCKIRAMSAVLARPHGPFPLDNIAGFKYLEPAFHLPVKQLGGNSMGAVSVVGRMIERRDKRVTILLRRERRRAMGKALGMRCVWGLWGVLAGALLMMSVAQAEVTSDLSGSVVVFPKVVSNEVRDTVLQLTNTSNNLVHAHCFYVNAAPLDPSSRPGSGNPRQWPISALAASSRLPAGAC